MKYLLLYIPLILFVLSYGYNKRYYRLIHSSGRVAEITEANHRSRQCIVLAVLTLAVFLVIVKLI